MGLLDFFNKVNGNNTFNEIINPTSVGFNMMLMMEDLIAKAEEWEKLPIPVEHTVVMPDRVKTLIDLGFTSHANVIEYNNAVRNAAEKYKREKDYYDNLQQYVEALKLLIEARKHFGPNTLLLPFDKFDALCKKYNLSGGPFSTYRGDIPQDALSEIIELSKKESTFDNIVKLCPIEGIKCEYSSGLNELSWIRKKLSDFSLVKYAEGYGNRILRLINDDLIQLQWCEISVGDPTDYFIVAPKSMFNEKFKVEINANKDPFICAYTNYGVLIFVKWGEEANDETIKKFEEFNTMLDNFEKTYFNK